LPHEPSGLVTTPPGVKDTGVAVRVIVAVNVGVAIGVNIFVIVPVIVAVGVAVLVTVLVIVAVDGFAGTRHVPHPYNCTSSIHKLTVVVPAVAKKVV
jgi:hypothetical protein